MQICAPCPRDGWKLLFDNCIAGMTLRFGIGILDREMRDFVVEVVPTLLPLELFSWVVSPPLVSRDCIRSCQLADNITMQQNTRWHVCIATEAFPSVLRRQMYIEFTFLSYFIPELRALQVLKCSVRKCIKTRWLVACMSVVWCTSWK